MNDSFHVHLINMVFVDFRTIVVNSTRRLIKSTRKLMLVKINCQFNNHTIKPVNTMTNYTKKYDRNKKRMKNAQPARWRKKGIIRKDD